MRIQLISQRTVCTLQMLGLVLVLVACEPAPRLSPLAADAVILAFGDSLTYGTGASPEHSYPAQLTELSQRRVVNAGLPGEISAAGLRRLPQLLQQYRPQLLLLCHGGNDILRHLPEADTVRHLQAMIDLARAANVEVVLIGVPEFGLFPSSAEFYADLAARNRIPGDTEVLADILTQASLKSDHIHPNAAGYRRLAEAILILLTSTGAIRPED